MSGRRAWRVPVVLAIAGAAALLALAPARGSGAYWTITPPTTAGSLGTGQWCAAPDPTSGASTASNPNHRFIRLTDPHVTVTGTNGHILIIPVANVGVWGGDGATARTLSVRLWSCTDGALAASSAVLSNGLRITAWSNPSGTIPARAWLAGSETVTPDARLDPASGLGAQLASLAQAASVSATKPLVTPPPSGDLRRYSWLFSSGRSSSAPASVAAVPAACNHLLSVAASCTVAETNASGTDNPFSTAFDTTPWGAPTIESITYPGGTLAVQSASGWGASGAYINENCPVGLVLCTPTASTVWMGATIVSDSTLLASTNGNLLQWVVIQWNGPASATPTADMVVEIALT